jgi:hypothetical protein
MKKQNKMHIKVRDLKPKKDAKGGRKHHHHRYQPSPPNSYGPNGVGKWDY